MEWGLSWLLFFPSPSTHVEIPAWNGSPALRVKALAYLGITTWNGVNHTLSYECASQEVSLEGMKGLWRFDRNASKPLFSLIAAKAAIVNQLHGFSVCFASFHMVTPYTTSLFHCTTDPFSTEKDMREKNELLRLNYDSQKQPVVRQSRLFL
jgi:hypothetical protein